MNKFSSILFLILTINLIKADTDCSVYGECKICDSTECLECYGYAKLDTDTKKCVDKCDEQHYWVHGDECDSCMTFTPAGSCYKCHNSAESVLCDQCTNNYQKIFDKSISKCSQYCTNTQYMDISGTATPITQNCKECSASIPNCVECECQFNPASDATCTVQCNACDSSHNLSSNTCVAKCSNAGEYYDPSYGCQKCPVGCTACAYDSDLKRAVCSACYTDYTLSADTQLCKSNHCNLQQYYDTTTSSCKNCPANCDYCKSGTTCDYCELGYDLSENSCSLHCKDEATVFNADTGKCSECPYGCKTCTHHEYSKLKCTECYPKQFLLNPTTNECDNQQFCAEGLFYNPTSSKCEACMEGCEQCASATKCHRCSSQYSIQEDFTCKKHCPYGEYFDLGVTECKACIEDCTVCNDGMSCTQCQEGYMLTGDSQKCVSECGLFQYYNTDKKTCSYCPLGCEHCTHVSNSKVICNQCLPVAFKLNPDTLECDDQNKCAVGEHYLESTSQCTPCSKGCDFCMAYTHCYNCNHQYLPTSDGNYCTRICDAGKYSKGGECLSCMNNCLDCDDDATCNECADGFNLNADKTHCTQICPDRTVFNPVTEQCSSCHYGCGDCGHVYNSQLKCNSCISIQFKMNPDTNQCDETDVCKDGQYYDNSAKKCLSCMPGCKKCMIYAECHTCEDQYLASEYTCKRICPDGEYLSSTHTCAKCMDNCALCSAKDTCDICEAGYLLLADKAHCSAMCSEGTIYNPDKNVCSNCPYGCSKCEHVAHSQLKCTACVSKQFTLTGDECKENKELCGTGQYFDDNSNKCLSCITGCDQCMYYKECHNCNAQYKPNGVICERICAEKLFYSSQTHECKNCMGNCVSCSSQDKCDICQAGYLLSADKTHCAAMCNEGTIYNPDKNVCSNCPYGCSKCEHVAHSQLKCTACVSKQFTLKDDECIENKELCGTGEYFNNDSNKCKPCMTGCDKCMYYKECHNCNSQYKPNGVVCEKICEESLFYSKDHTCESCIANCKICSDATTCEECEEGYLLNDKKQCYTKTQICQAGQYEFNGQCITCSTSIQFCATCKLNDKNSVICTKCMIDFELDPTQTKCTNASLLILNLLNLFVLLFFFFK